MLVCLLSQSRSSCLYAYPRSRDRLAVMHTLAIVIVVVIAVATVMLIRTPSPLRTLLWLGTPLPLRALLALPLQLFSGCPAHPCRCECCCRIAYCRRCNRLVLSHTLAVATVLAKLLALNVVSVLLIYEPPSWLSLSSPSSPTLCCFVYRFAMLTPCSRHIFLSSAYTRCRYAHPCSCEHSASLLSAAKGLLLSLLSPSQGCLPSLNFTVSRALLLLRPPSLFPCSCERTVLLPIRVGLLASLPRSMACSSRTVLLLPHSRWEQKLVTSPFMPIFFLAL